MVNLDLLSTVLTRQVGFAVGADRGDDAHRVVLRPLGIHPNESFTIQCEVQWRRLRCRFSPGPFARDLVDQMSRSSPETRRKFSLLASSLKEQGKGVELDIRINGLRLFESNVEDWPTDWTSFQATLEVGPLVIPQGTAQRQALVTEWSGKLLTLVSLLLPLVEMEGTAEDDETSFTSGFEDGKERLIASKKYERDPRNRAICLAVRGHDCHGCGIDFADAYGPVAAGYIHVHHLEPVSSYDGPRQIDPTRDLIPLCPNCHAVVHRRTPPYGMDELHQFLHR